MLLSYLVFAPRGLRPRALAFLSLSSFILVLWNSHPGDVDPPDGTIMLAQGNIQQLSQWGDVFNVGHRFSWGVYVVPSQEEGETTLSLKSPFILATL